MGGTKVQGCVRSVRSTVEIEGRCRMGGGLAGGTVSSTGVNIGDTHRCRLCFASSWAIPSFPHSSIVAMSRLPTRFTDRSFVELALLVLLLFMVEYIYRTVVINRAPGAWSAVERFTRRRF